MEVKWYGHASFLITTEKGITIISDPYEPGAYGGGISYGPIPDEADIVTVSHDHSDHNYVKGLPGNPQQIKGAGRHEAKGIIFEGIATYHDATKGSERGENTIFTFSADGIKICHLGDLGHVLSDRDINAIGEIDVLFIPVGGFYTIDPKEATEVVNQLKPKVVIPMHYKTERCEFPIEPVESFLKGKKDVKKIDGSSASFTEDDFKEGSKIVVLQSAL